MWCFVPAGDDNESLAQLQVFYLFSHHILLRNLENKIEQKKIKKL
jgi:hypothetical protein